MTPHTARTAESRTPAGRLTGTAATAAGPRGRKVAR